MDLVQTMETLKTVTVLGLAFMAFACRIEGTPGTATQQEDDEELYKLPEGFLFGLGTSSYQVEGAWNEDGKGVNVFDYATHENGIGNADVACNHYHRYKEDIALLRQMKANVYRFSISWARIFPDGYRSSLEPRGVKHYHDVIDELLKNGIEPLITMSHFDYPRALHEEFNGWWGEKMIDVFADYADFLFSEYGHKVKYWTTLNEPNVHCRMMQSDGSTVHSRGQPGGGVAEGPNENENSFHVGVHHEILAHTQAYRIYVDKYNETQKGLVGIGVMSEFTRPNSTAYEDINAAHNSNIDSLGRIIHPFVYGDYPAILLKQGQVLNFTEEQKKFIKGATDYIAINIYNGRITSANSAVQSGGSRARDESTYWALGDLSLWMKHNYGKIGIFFTEHGVDGEDSGSLNDWNSRSSCLSSYLRHLVKVTNVYNLNVIGYTYWALLDSYEFSAAEPLQNGIVAVDFDGGTLDRTLRDSWKFFEEVGRTKKIPLVNGSSRC